MNNSTTNAYEMKREIVNFSKKVKTETQTIYSFTFKS